MKKNIVLMLLAFNLSGCISQGQWYKPGASYQELQEVNYRCLQEAQQPFASANAGLYNNGNAHTHNTPNFSSNYSSGMTTNQNLFNACMNAYGFYWVIKENYY